MDIVALLVILAVIAAAAAIVSAPLRGDVPREGSDPRGDRLAELEARKEAKYREIRDAEMDFRTGKLSEDDHRTLDRQLRAEAMDVLRAIDDEG